MKTRFLHAVAIVMISMLIGFIVDRVLEMWIFKISFPEQSALNDFEFEDFAFSTRQTEDARDQNIILVNIGQLGRAGIAEQIRILSQYNPKVIGVNVIFACSGPRDTIHCPQLKDELGNAMLHEAIKKAGNVVLVSRLLQSQSAHPKDADPDSLEVSDTLFSLHATNGFANLVTATTNASGVKSCRSVIPWWRIDGRELHSFSVEVARKFDTAKADRFLRRDIEEELINYKGNISVRGVDQHDEVEYYRTLEYEDVLLINFDTTLITNKILLLGYFGDYLLDNRSDEMFYSPLNRVVLGKSPPDMYGTVVHANILSMILDEDYINRFSNVFAWMISILIVVLNAFFFTWLHHRNTIWYEPMTLLVPAAQIIVISYLRHLLFTRFSYILDLSVATILLLSVSLSAGLYLGPVRSLATKWISKRKSISQNP